MRSSPLINPAPYTLTILFLLATLLTGCKEDDAPPAPYTLDLSTLPIVFVLEEEQADMATGTGTGGNDNGGRSNTSNCCPSIQIIDEGYAADLRVARAEEAFIENPFGMLIDTDPTDPIVIELREPSGGSLGPYSLEVAQGEGIAINTSKLNAGEHLLTISVSGQATSNSFFIDP